MAVALPLLFLTACGDGNDINDKTIRIKISPTSQSVEAGGEVELTVDARNTEIKWPELDAVEGSFNTRGNVARYTPPSIAGTYRFTVTAQADTLKTVTARITVVYSDPEIEITPSDPPEIKIGKTIQFSAKKTIPMGQPQIQDLLWEVTGADCGTIDQNGLFSAARAGDCKVNASLRNNNNKKITESVTVKITDTTLDDIISDMVEVRGGTFTMGCAVGQADCPDNATTAHSVTLNAFYIGRYEVNQFLWKQIMGTNFNPSGNQGNNFPVENVSWDDVQTFLERLNDRTGRADNSADKVYRLPTEAEWEYAARGGNQSRGYLYSGGNTLDDVGWYKENSDVKTHPIGTKQANELGLYDMSGNVDEWVHGDSQSTTTGTNRIVRGGSSVRNEEGARVFSRGGCTGLCDPNFYLGFRLAITSTR